VVLDQKVRMAQLIVSAITTESKRLVEEM